MITNENRNVNLNFEKVDNYSTSKHETVSFLKSLYSNCTQGYINVRILPSGGNLFFSQIDSILEILETNRDENIFFGVATRINGNGTKAGILQIPALWVDIDFKDLIEGKIREIQKLIRDFPLKPTFVVNSGGGIHAYWKLKEPVIRDEISKVENLLRRLASFFYGDMASTDASRILRLVGSINHKYPHRPVVSILKESFHPEREFSLDDFDGILPETKLTDRPLSNPLPNLTDVWSLIKDGIVEQADPPVAFLVREAVRKAIPGRRNIEGYALASQLYAFGVSKGETIKAMGLYVKLIPRPKDYHRYTLREAVLTVRQVWKDSGELLHEHLHPVEGVGDDCLGYGDRTVRLPLYGPNGELSVYFLLEIQTIRNEQTKDLHHTCRCWKNPEKSGPYDVSVPKEERGRNGKVGMSFGKIWTCPACAVLYLRRLAKREIRQLYPDGLFFEVFHYIDEKFYRAIKKGFDRAGALSKGIVNFTEKVFLMLSDVNANGRMSFVSWNDPLMDALLNRFLDYDPQKPKNRKKVRSPREEKMGKPKEDSTHYHFTVHARNEEEIYQALEKMGCRVNRETEGIEYSDEALSFFWKKAKVREENKKKKREGQVIIPIFDSENLLERAM